MAKQTFKATLTAAKFPLSYYQASRSVLQPGEDIAPRTNQQFTGNVDSFDYNLIQLLLAENVLPIAKGLASASFAEIYAAYEPATTDFDQLIIILDDSDYAAVFSPARGKNYVYTEEAGEWISYDPFVWPSEFRLVTHGYVAGRTLIFYERTKLVEWNKTTVALDTLTLTLPIGYVVTDIRGNSAASNYHLLFTHQEVLWSTPQDPLEFADVNQGAGRQIPIDLRGEITAIVPIAGGFLICTTQNIVAASFTNDAARPFAFREVRNSAGLDGPEQITEDSNAVGHYAYGAGGLQQVSLQQADSVFPETADFLTANKIESWDTSAKTVVYTTRSNFASAKLKLLGNRYLAISYGAIAGLYEFVLMYDIALERWGKLRIQHTDCAELPAGSIVTYLAYYELIVYGAYEDIGTVAYEDLFSDARPVPELRASFGFLQPDGTVMLLVMDGVDGSASDTSAVVLFGHIQVRRSRMVTVSAMEIDGLSDTPEPEVTLLTSTTGYARDGVTAMTELQRVGNFVSYGSRVTTKNADVAVEGSFELTNLIMETIIHGAR